MQDDKVRDAVLKVALGVRVAEVAAEYGMEDGEMRLVKRRETHKDIPPDLKAVRLLLEGSDYSSYTDEQLETERQRLLRQLESEKENV